MKRIASASIVLLLMLSTMMASMPTMAATTKNYGNVTLSGGFQAGHFNDVWDLTAGDITIAFTYDATGMVDDAGAHAWAELGVRSLGTAEDFNPFTRYNTKVTDLVAGQSGYCGFVWAWLSGNYLYVKYLVTEPGCFIVETHLAIIKVASNTVYPADIPQTKKGDPIPGKFSYSMDHSPPVSEYTYVIDLNSISGSGPVLALAAHAIVVCSTVKKTAWGAGKDFNGANWATYFYYQLSSKAGSGIWLATDYDGTPNTFDPDPVGAPNLDMDDKLILQPKVGWDEGHYNLPSSPAQYWNNYGFWFDRDGVDQWQALMWGCINGGTYNTAGKYNVVITLHYTGSTTGTAYMTVNGVPQGFYNGPWYNGQPALYPVGQTFSGDMAHLQVFYGLYGYGATHTASFKAITVTQ